LGGGSWKDVRAFRFHPFSQGAADMTPLRQKMIRELELHRKSPRTVEAYVTAVAQLARHYGRSPDAIAIEEVRDFLHYLITQRKVAFSTCNQKLAGIRFFHRQVLGHEAFCLRVPANLDLHDLADYFPETAGHLDQAIRSVIGMDAEAVHERFTQFVQEHPNLASHQIRFLDMLQNHIAKYGSIEVDRLYEPPFTLIHSDGLDGVFNEDTLADKLLAIVDSFKPEAT
jgi:type I site-specific restriction endonuclease